MIEAGDEGESVIEGAVAGEGAGEGAVAGEGEGEGETLAPPFIPSVPPLHSLTRRNPKPGKGIRRRCCAVEDEALAFPAHGGQ